jgi:predicted DNA-binding protein (UPF0251 family)
MGYTTRFIAEIKMSLEKRFLSKVDKTKDGCWEWTGAKSNGYGYLWNDGKLKRATHISLLLVGIVVPSGLYALHKCDNPSCVNPDHLFLGTQKDNLQDASKKKRCGAQISPEKYKNGKPPVMKGESNPASKLKAEEVEEIRQLYSSRLMTQVELAAKFNVSQAMISLIIRNKKW